MTSDDPLNTQQTPGSEPTTTDQNKFTHAELAAALVKPGELTHIASRGSFTTSRAFIPVGFLMSAAVLGLGAVIALVYANTTAGASLEVLTCEYLCDEVTAAAKTHDTANAWLTFLAPAAALFTALTLWAWPIEYRRINN
ncbi:hypothetical protein [Streptomyces sp. NPDC058401]|uniref:hypothetical protein n=1 Tax=Streptomyces sp. NPDC058401 TaxID=3346480 RepID=UPI0036566BC0